MNSNIVRITRYLLVIYSCIIMTEAANWYADTSKNCFECAEQNVENMMCSMGGKLEKEQYVACCSPALDDSDEECKPSLLNVCTQPFKVYKEKKI